MTTEHPITPQTELIKQWLTEFYGPQSMPGMAPGEMVLHVAAVAARWGADQELEACCEWLDKAGSGLAGTYAAYLRAARRPKSPSLKEQALKALKNIDDACESEGFSLSDDTDIICRALEALPD